jgi:hypothetical protein
MCDTTAIYIKNNARADSLVQMPDNISDPRNERGLVSTILAQVEMASIRRSPAQRRGSSEMVLCDFGSSPKCFSAHNRIRAAH